VRRALALLALGAGAIAPAPAAAAAPKISQLVVFRDGSAVAKQVKAKATSVKLGRKRCGVADSTALAALVRSRPGKLRLHDFGSCSRRAADGAGLFVAGIRGDLNRGQNGWVYKVGNRAASAGAADPGGPFGRGRLRSGQRVTWFYCRMKSGGCQRTLAVKLRASAGTLTASVKGYDDQGHAAAVPQAIVTAGTFSAVTVANGTATLDLPAGRYSVVAGKPGLVRSFAERVEVP
jgi:hypothetical protein